MCQNLVTYDGFEIECCRDARLYGLAIGTDDYTEDGACLCNADLETAFAQHSSEWKRGVWGWDEVGPDGRTWYEGYDIETRDTEWDNLVHVSRSDGKTEASWENVLQRLQ